MVCSLSAHSQELEVAVKLKVFDGELEGATISIVATEQSKTVVSPKKKRTKLELNFGNTYTIRFEKPGYLTKEVLIDTRNVPLHMREEYLDFGFEIELHKEIEYPIIESDSLKMAQWQYLTDYGMFDYERIDKCFATRKDDSKKQSNVN